MEWKKRITSFGTVFRVVEEKEREGKCVNEPEACDRGEIRRKHYKWNMM